MARLELEIGTDVLLLETGDALLLELTVPPSPPTPVADGRIIRLGIIRKT